MKNRNRREAQLRGQIEIRKPTFNAFCKAHDRFSVYQKEWNYRNSDEPSLYIPVKRFRAEELETLVKLMEKESPRPQATISQINGHLTVIRNPVGKDITQLTTLESAILSYVREGIIEGWMFSKVKNENFLQPMLVDSCAYYPPVVHERGDRTPAHTTLTLIYWQKGKIHTERFTWYMNELGKTVDKLLLDKGLIKETSDLVKQYYKDEKVFLEWRQQMGVQFLGTGNFSIPDTWREHDSELHNTRLVIDDRCDDIDNKRATAVFRTDEDEYSEECDIDPEKAERYTRVPLGFYIWVFNLDSHRNGFVHTSTIKPYVYNPALRDKLILPPEHQDLIDALTGDMDVLMEDIVSGKSGGTTILCQGKAGTGKTLTAEIYAEVVKRPLYRVHSGQLGIDAEGVESELKAALNRAKRWGAVMLIDEADVFIAQRGNDLQQNAVCGVFLRLLEYYDGLLFLTTNRADTVDDAILSRCIAHIKFDAPDEDERTRLWFTLGEVFQLKLAKDKKTCVKLSKMFPTATGRDIKGLIRLVIKHSRQRKKVPNVEDVKRLATFKGL